LKLVAKQAVPDFYEGEIASEIVKHLAARGGLLTEEDFTKTESTWVKPIATHFRRHDIFEIPPNGQGLTVLITLNILKHFGLRRFEPESPERRHLEIEALKLAWVLRNRHIADPDLADVPVSELLSEETSQRLASLIDLNRTTDANISLPSSDTVYLSIVDKNRLSISFINSIYYDFGSAFITPSPASLCRIVARASPRIQAIPKLHRPSKRPLHTIIRQWSKKREKLT
jgi:gamma-glutamyltranspeptidase/glutathione hydrolase